MGKPAVARAWLDGQDGPVPGVDCSKDVVLTKQSFKEEVDVNKIIEKAARGQVVPGQLRDPIYEDFSSMPSYQEALNLVLRAEEQFAGLDAKLRSRFGNDPSQFLAFMEDPKNVEEHISLGLATRRKEDLGGGAGSPGEQGGGAGGSPGGANPKAAGQAGASPLASSSSGQSNGAGASK
ncbi:scaffold protein [Microviridae sp.]|nr:scaffold protein [Microviridae sp.]